MNIPRAPHREYDVMLWFDECYAYIYIYVEVFLLTVLQSKLCFGQAFNIGASALHLAGV